MSATRSSPRALSSAVFVLLILAAAVSGCLGGKGPAQTSAPAPATGDVAGRVLDDARAPIAQAEVRVLLTEFAARTNAAGEYSIRGVGAGPIRVVASADGWTSQTRTAELSPGTELRLDFELAPTVRIVPYNRTFAVEGHITCGLPQGAACPGDVSMDVTTHKFAVDAFLRGIVVELRWTAQADPVNQQLAMDLQAATAAACGRTYATATGASVLRLQPEAGFPVSGGAQCLQVRPPGDAPTVDLSYEAFVSVFYHEPPPAGFTAIPAS